MGRCGRVGKKGLILEDNVFQIAGMGWEFEIGIQVPRLRDNSPVPGDTFPAPW